MTISSQFSARTAPGLLMNYVVGECYAHTKIFPAIDLLDTGCYRHGSPRCRAAPTAVRNPSQQQLRDSLRGLAARGAPILACVADARIWLLSNRATDVGGSENPCAGIQWDRQYQCPNTRPRLLEHSTANGTPTAWSVRIRPGTMAMAGTSFSGIRSDPACNTDAEEYGGRPLRSRACDHIGMVRARTRVVRNLGEMSAQISIRTRNALARLRRFWLEGVDQRLAVLGFKARRVDRIIPSSP